MTTVTRVPVLLRLQHQQYRRLFTRMAPNVFDSSVAQRQTAPHCLAAPPNANNNNNVSSYNFQRRLSTTDAKKGPYTQLPPLPAPNPERTLDHFLNFAQPLLVGKPDEFERTKRTVLDFVHNELPKLQDALEKRAAGMKNWLSPWWLDIAYLEGRTPLPVVTSPGVMFPPFPFEGEQGQAEYAARITVAALEFYLKIKRQELKEDRAGKDAFDMSQYAYMFGTTRAPARNKDRLIYGVDRIEAPRHIVVFCRSHAFKITVLDGGDGVVKVDELANTFVEIRRLANQKGPAAGVGVVSSEDRESWAAVYERLKENRGNAATIDAIESSLFTLSLDEKTRPESGRTEADEAARQTLHGGGFDKNSANRWFDKCLQFIVGPSGRTGMCYEHTPADGPPVAALMDNICDQIEATKASTPAWTGSQKTLKIQELDFEVDSAVKSAIETAARNIEKIAGDLDVKTYAFRKFGKGFVKKQRVSPDSFVQLAFQLAYYNLHGEFPPTYETATLRRFHDGRTENIRSPSPPMATFCQLMAARAPAEEAAKALRAACEAHKNYTLDCMGMRGMDRHILAWRLLASENGLPAPSIARLPVYKEMTHFRVSTSQVPTKHHIHMCFGPSDSDCYGICYNPQEDAILAVITAFRHGQRSAEKFAAALDQAFLDMRRVLEEAPAPPPPAKL